MTNRVRATLSHLRPLAIAATLASLTAFAAAQADVASAETAPADLPITRVVLFTNGVGYFEHEGTVTGTQELALDVPVEQMDDLLQSLVVQDFDGGDVRPVRYGSRDPLARILDGYAIDLSGNPTLLDVLEQARGERVTLEATQPIEGTVVGVERVTVPDEAPRAYLTLVTETGLRRVNLDEVREFRFENAELRAELDAALAAIAQYRASGATPVAVRFEGEGERRVRVAYVREMPVWKTSYRLVMGDAGTAELQGWAIIDNPTDLDLVDVQVAFVAGQPISFITGLYEPVYVTRPRVEPSVAASVLPGADEGEFAPSAQLDARGGAPSAAMESAADAAFGAVAAAPRLAEAGVASMASGVRFGATFAYVIEEPVTVRRHESAMVPIVVTDIEAHDLALYDPTVLPANPLRAVRLVNDTGLHLAAGSVTVYDAGGFAGTARLADLVPGDDRLLSYAVDLDLTLDASDARETEELVAATIAGGFLEVQELRRLTARVQIQPLGEVNRFLVVEVPRRAGFELVSPAPAAPTTPTAHRLGVAVATDGGDVPSDTSVPTHVVCLEVDEACVLEVVLERVDTRRIAVANVSSDQIAVYLENVELSAEDRATLERIQDLQRSMGALDRSIADVDRRVDAIHQEQNRIRQNMSALDRNSDLYRRYVGQLDDQEDELMTLAEERERLQQERAALRQDLDDLVRDLTGNGG
ncbi:MAG: hypothetical protein R6W77_10495 [Trueperaceae bacterium]